MEELQKEKPLLHLFICTNEKKEINCAQKGSLELRQKLKQMVREKYGKKVRVTASRCLGFCSEGIATVLYPDGEWHLKVNPNDLPALFKKIEEKMAQKT